MGIADDSPRRREPDDTVLPIVMLKVEERLREDRHAFRQELAAIAAKQEAAQAQASAEHAVLRSDVADLRRDVESLVPTTEDLRGQVTALRETGLVDAAHEETLMAMRKMLARGMGLLIAFIGAMTGVLAVVNH